MDLQVVVELSNSALKSIDDGWDFSLSSELCDQLIFETLRIKEHPPKQLQSFFEIFKKHISEAKTIRGKFYSDYYLSVTEEADEIFRILKIR